MAAVLLRAALTPNVDLARLCFDECEDKIYDLRSITLRLDQVTVREVYEMLSRHKIGLDNKIEPDGFEEVMEEVFRRGSKTGSVTGKTAQYRRVVRKLYNAIDANADGVLTRTELCCGLSLMCRPEGSRGDEANCVEDCLRLPFMCQSGNLDIRVAESYLTVTFSFLLSLSPTLSCAFRSGGAEELAKRAARTIFHSVSKRNADANETTMPLLYFTKWIEDAREPEKISEARASELRASVMTKKSGSPDGRKISKPSPRSGTKYSYALKQWLEKDGNSTSASTPHMLPHSPTVSRAPFGTDNQPATKEHLLFDRVYGSEHEGKVSQESLVLGDLTPKRESDYAQSDASLTPKLPPSSPQQVKFIRDHLHSLLREFTRGAISSQLLRSRLRALGISIPHDADKEIAAAEENGASSFRTLLIAFEGAVPKAIETLQLEDRRRPSKASTISQPFSTDVHSHGDVVAWRSVIGLDDNSDSGKTKQDIARYVMNKSLSSRPGLLTWCEGSSQATDKRGEEQQKDASSSDAASVSTQSVVHPWQREGSSNWRRGKAHFSTEDVRSSCPFGTSRDVNGGRPVQAVKSGRRYYQPGSNRGNKDSVDKCFRPQTSERPQPIRTYRRRDQRTHLHTLGLVQNSPRRGEGVRRFRNNPKDAWLDHHRV